MEVLKKQTEVAILVSLGIVRVHGQPAQTPQSFEDMGSCPERLRVLAVLPRVHRATPANVQSITIEQVKESRSGKSFQFGLTSWSSPLKHSGVLSNVEDRG